MGASAKEIRSLVAMVEAASTARVLNLARRPAAVRALTAPERTMFRSPTLDRAILMKHRLTATERRLFRNPRAVVTKLLIPIDPLDLTAGANTLLVGQFGFDEALVNGLGVERDTDAGRRDRELLRALNELPSLDPFLTREHLTRHGFGVADDYFDIDPADAARMLDFTRGEIVPLITLCFGGGDTVAAERLAQKLLASQLDASMEPLRLTLKMTSDEFVEGVFCWKGFLYYKWVLTETLRAVGDMTRELAAVRPVGPLTGDEKGYVAQARGRILEGVKAACRNVRGSLVTYDGAFEALTQHADPVAFRDFLLAAPRMFFEVGERIGAVQHITSLWRHRFPEPDRGVPSTELVEALVDFEASLGAAAGGPQRRAA